MRRRLTILAAIVASMLVSDASYAQTTRYALESAKGLELHDAVALWFEAGTIAHFRNASIT